MLTKFTDYSVADKMRIMLEDHNVENIYEQLAKFNRVSVDDLKKLYTIEFNPIRKRIYIKGLESHLCPLLLRLSETGLKFESVTSNTLRIDLGMFLTKVR
jgi:hypothetical protein